MILVPEWFQYRLYVLSNDERKISIAMEDRVVSLKSWTNITYVKDHGDFSVESSMII
jgi:hypothetical protein